MILRWIEDPLRFGIIICDKTPSVFNGIKAKPRNENAMFAFKEAMEMFMIKNICLTYELSK